MAQNNYFVRICFNNDTIYDIDVKAKNKPEAYRKAKQRLAKQLFKMSKLKQYSAQLL